MTAILSLLTSILQVHVGVGQDCRLSASSVFISLETVPLESLSNKTVQQVANGQIRLPVNINISTTANQSHVSLRVRLSRFIERRTYPRLFQSMMSPLAPAAQSESRTNLSTSVSLSIIDGDGQEIPVQATREDPFELIIPRDANLIVPAMTLQNVTSFNSTQLFDVHYVNITGTLPVSVHFEIRPIDRTLGYLFIYQFDRFPRLNSSTRDIDGWSLLCPSSE